MKILHLTASTFFGGPERGLITTVRSLAEPEFGVEGIIGSFYENGNCQSFMQELAKVGIEGRVLEHDMPNLVGAYRDLVRLLRDEKIDLLSANGHKARMIGWFATRRVGIPIVGVSRGWTWQDWKVSLYERLDQWMHRRMDRVICVSQGQADKVIKTGTPKNRIVVIRNAIDTTRFDTPPDSSYRSRLEAYFEKSPELIIGAAGRLSPEKGFDVMIDAVKIVIEENPSVSFGVVLFGEGFMREPLQDRIDKAKLADQFKMVGFTSELDKFLPHFDIFAQSSHTEGFPCVNVEAMVARVPVIATSVGGVPEQIVPNETGLMVPPNNPKALADGLRELLLNKKMREEMGERGRQKAVSEFTCREFAKKYFELFQEVLAK